MNTIRSPLSLLPTFIVGLYGQNFRNIPELRWNYGYAYVWGVIVVTTASRAGAQARCVLTVGKPGCLGHRHF